MSNESIRDLLPDKPRKGLMEWGIKTAHDELGGNFIIFNRESVEIAPSLKQTMTADDWDKYEAAIQRRWAANCECSACGESFYGGWEKKKRDKYMIRMAEGEDGVVYDGVPEKSEMENTALWEEGEIMPCPVCGERAKLIHSSRLRHGRIYAVMLGTLERCGKYAVLVYWLLRREIDEFGISDYSIRPREAVVIDEGGKLRRFSRTSYGDFAERETDHWEMKTFMDPEQIQYHSYGNGLHEGRNTIGAYWWKDVPSMIGTTGEKTGIYEYVRAGFQYPAVYLRLWQEHSNVENLLKAGFTRLIYEAIDSVAEENHMYGMKILSVEIDWINWKEQKPHMMLGVKKEELEILRHEKWTRDKAVLWSEYINLPRKRELEAFISWVREYGMHGTERVIHAYQHGDPEPGKVFRYLDGQKDIPKNDRVGTWMDYGKMKNMIDMLADDGRRGEEFPKNLRSAHDRLAESLKFTTDAELEMKFRELKTLYAPLEWTDGDLCIVVPSCNGDLISEGKTLHHCVGGYGETHCSMHPIFFVRHYRRPERSYFTLNEDLSQITAKRIQLHGYRNELGGKLKIPKEVFDFVERWEKEILAPWLASEWRKRAKTIKANSRKVNAA